MEHQEQFWLAFKLNREQGITGVEAMFPEFGDKSGFTQKDG
jgi:hypothetical protein